eukprot:10636789-Lingulodinium_polyedra.AAC.1
MPRCSSSFRKFEPALQIKGQPKWGNILAGQQKLKSFLWTGYCTNLEQFVLSGLTDEWTRFARAMRSSRL